MKDVVGKEGEQQETLHGVEPRLKEGSSLRESGEERAGALGGTRGVGEITGAKKETKFLHFAHGLLKSGRPYLADRPLIVAAHHDSCTNPSCGGIQFAQVRGGGRRGDLVKYDFH